MPVTIEWDNPNKTIMKMSFVGHWTWTEVYLALPQGDKLLEEIDYSISVIIDWSRSLGIPPSALTHAGTLARKQNPKVNMTVFVGASTFFTTLWGIFSKLNSLFARPERFVFADSLEEARIILAKPINS